MIKYVRIFDGIYKVKEQIDDKYILFDKKGFGGTSILYEKEKHRESDNLEDLLDYLVAVKDNEIEPFAFFPIKDVIGNETNYPDIIEEGYNYFGAIWIDKGLKYVAKLNKNGEWELI